MLKRIALTISIACTVLAVPNVQAVWEYANKPFVGKYQVYGGFLDEAHSPSAGDTKVAITISENAAKEMFNAIGPDVDSGCKTQDLRLRQRDMLLCRYRPKDGYWCTFGFDLSTGLSIGGTVGGAACPN